MPSSRKEVCLFLKRIKRRIIPTRGVVGNDDGSVSNPEKYGFGRAAESISDGHGKNVKVVIESVSIACKMSSWSRRDRWMQSKIFDRGRKQACHKLTMKIDGNEVQDLDRRKRCVPQVANCRYVCTDRRSNGLLESDHERGNTMSAECQY